MNCHFKMFHVLNIFYVFNKSPVIVSLCYIKMTQSLHLGEAHFIPSQDEYAVLNFRIDYGRTFAQIVNFKVSSVWETSYYNYI